MTDFRQVWCLHAYSGGTVRDSHPVFYSLVVLLPHPQALKRNIYLHGQYTRLGFKCQSQKEKTLIYDTNRNKTKQNLKIVGKIQKLLYQLDTSSAIALDAPIYTIPCTQKAK